LGRAIIRVLSSSEQSDELGRELHVLASIAISARRNEVRLLVAPAAGERNNMVNVPSRRQVASAVPALATRFFVQLAAQLLRPRSAPRYRRHKDHFTLSRKAKIKRQRLPHELRDGDANFSRGGD